MSSDQPKYFLVQSDAWCQPPNLEWLATLDEPVTCRLGHVTYPRRVDVVAMEAMPESLANIPLSDNQRTVDKGRTITIMSGPLCDAIGVEVLEESYFLGSVTFRDHPRRAGYRSLVLKSNALVVPIRSEARTFDFQFCKFCGEPDYLAVGSGVILDSAIKHRAPLYPTSLCRLLLREDVAKRARSHARGVQYDAIRVAKAPEDGLPEDLRELPRDFTHKLKPPPTGRTCKTCGKELKSRTAKVCFQCGMKSHPQLGNAP